MKRMQTLKSILQAIVNFGNELGLIPRSFMNAIRQRRQQTVVDENEVERLDRIRNPSKYRGK